MRLILQILSAALIGMPNLAAAHSEAEPNDRRAVVAGLNAFNVDLYHEVAKAKPGNVFISGTSVSAAFGLAQAGAVGPTARNIAEVLHYPFDGNRLAKANGNLLETLTTAGASAPAINNAIWLQTGLPVSKSYLDLVHAFYGAGLKYVDFRDSASASKAIDDWVAHATRDRIRDLLSPHDVEDTVSVLVNTIYFKAGWNSPFDRLETRTGAFIGADGHRRDVPLMHQQLEARYLDGGTFAAVSLPYADSRQEMLVFLPKANTGLPAFEKMMTPARLVRWSSAIQDAPFRNISLTLPKVHLAQRSVLKDRLIAMGMTVPFSRRADFSAMKPVDLKSDDPLDWRLAIGTVIHQTFLDVDEAGSQAAAATAITDIVVSGARIRPKAITFRADHPFFFLIRDTRTGTILFAGRLTQP